MIAFALAVALATLAAGLTVSLALRLLPSLRLRLAGLALVAALLPLGAVLLSGLVMFDSEHDIAVLVVAVASSTAALFGGLLLARSVALPVEQLRAASERLASGELDSRAPEGGPTEVAELASSFNLMAASVESLFDARRQLVASASHDLRTPLAALQAMLEAVEDGLVEPGHYLPAMRQQVASLSSLVDDLFELARIDSGVLTLELHDARLDGLVESCLRGLEAEARARHVHLEARIDGPLPAVRCAPEKVERVLHNLLANALRHTPSDGAVAVLVERLSEEVRITVTDTGEGLPAADAERVFDRFWRGDRSRTGGGAGLGLAIARGLVEAQGGRIWAENRHTGGAAISFTLPAAAA